MGRIPTATGGGGVTSQSSPVSQEQNTTETDEQKELHACIEKPIYSFMPGAE